MLTTRISMPADPILDTDVFGDLLRQRRVESGLTQAALAERAGLSVRGISDLERGARVRPHRDTLLRLADALGMNGAARSAFLGMARSAPRGQLGLDKPRADTRLETLARLPSRS